MFLDFNSGSNRNRAYREMGDSRRDVFFFGADLQNLAKGFLFFFA
jgi:hypothetical protein